MSRVVPVEGKWYDWPPRQSLSSDTCYAKLTYSLIRLLRGIGHQPLFEPQQPVMHLSDDPVLILTEGWGVLERLSRLSAIDTLAEEGAVLLQLLEDPFHAGLGKRTDLLRTHVAAFEEGLELFDVCLHLFCPREVLGLRALLDDFLQLFKIYHCVGGIFDQLFETLLRVLCGIHAGCYLREYIGGG